METSDEENENEVEKKKGEGKGRVNCLIAKDIEVEERWKRNVENMKKK